MDRIGVAIVDRLIAASAGAPEALPYMRLVLPVTVRSLLELGFQLARGATINDASAAIGRRVVAGAQSALLHTEVLSTCRVVWPPQGLRTGAWMPMPAPG